MESDLSPKNTKPNCFQDVLYVRKKLDFPVNKEEIRELFDIGNHTALALTRANNLLLIDHTDRKKTSLKCVYKLPKILKQLGFIAKTHPLNIEYCFYLASNTLALKINNKIIFVSIQNYKEQSFQMLLPSFHRVFQLNNEFLLAPIYENKTGILRFLIIKWQTRQMKYLSYTSRSDPVDVKFISTIVGGVIDCSNNTGKPLKSDLPTQKKSIIVFLYQNGIIDLFDLQGGKIIVAMPNRIANEAFNKLFYLPQSRLIAQGSNLRIIFWDISDDNSKLHMRYKVTCDGLVNSHLTTQVGEYLFLVQENSATSLHFDSDLHAFQQNREAIKDTYPYDAENSEFFEQKITAIYPLGPSSFIIQREIKVLPQYEDDSVADELPTELEGADLQSLTKFVLSSNGVGLESNEFALRFTTDIETIAENSYSCLNEQGDCAFWNYETGDVRVVLATNEWGLGWQDNVYREIKYRDPALKEQDWEKSFYFMGLETLIFVVRHTLRGCLRYLIYHIAGNQTLLRIADSRDEWPKANLIFPISENELIIQFENLNMYPLLKINASTGNVGEMILSNCPLIHDNRFTIISRDHQIIALTSKNTLSVLYTQEKKYKMIKSFGSRIHEITTSNNGSLLALILEDRPCTMVFLKWDTGEIVASHDATILTVNHVHMYGNLGKELLFSACMGFMQGLEMNSKYEKKIHFPLRKDDKKTEEIYTLPEGAQVAFYRDMKVEKLTMRNSHENSNVAYYQLLGSESCMCGLSVCFTEKCYQIGLLRRINRRMLVLKIMREQIGKHYNSYILKSAFEFLFSKQPTM